MKKFRNAIQEAEVYAKLPFPLRLEFADDFGVGGFRETRNWWGLVWQVVEEELDGDEES